MLVLAQEKDAFTCICFKCECHLYCERSFCVCVCVYNMHDMYDAHFVVRRRHCDAPSIFHNAIVIVPVMRWATNVHSLQQHGKKCTQIHSNSHKLPTNRPRTLVRSVQLCSIYVAPLHLKLCFPHYPFFNTVIGCVALTHTINRVASLGFVRAVRPLQIDRSMHD